MFLITPLRNGIAGTPRLPTWVYGLHKSHPSTHGRSLFVCVLCWDFWVLTNSFGEKLPIKRKWRDEKPLNKCTHLFPCFKLSTDKVSRGQVFQELLTHFLSDHSFPRTQTLSMLHEALWWKGVSSSSRKRGCSLRAPPSTGPGEWEHKSSWL